MSDLVVLIIFLGIVFIMFSTGMLKTNTNTNANDKTITVQNTPPVESTPTAIPCEGAWDTQWSACSESCGGGTQTQTYRISVPGNTGSGCETFDGDTRSQPCNTQVCPEPCEGAWSGWSSCSVPCGGGTKTRTYSISVPGNSFGTSCDASDGATITVPCNTDPCPVDCEYKNVWTNSSCEEIPSTCARGGDGQGRWRQQQTLVPAIGTGAACDESRRYRDTNNACNYPSSSCPAIDCTYTPWVDSSECVANANACADPSNPRGTKSQTRDIDQPANFAGSCTGSREQNVPCTLASDFCSSDPCIYNDWV